MRWERLFDDLTGQLDSAAQVELDEEVADRTRREVAQLGLADRLRGAVGHELDVKVQGADVFRGVVRRAGPDWMLVEPRAAPPAVVVSEAIDWMRGLPGLALDAASAGLLDARVDLGHILRAVARDRATVRLIVRDGSQLVGTIDRVGRDFVDLAEHHAGEARRSGEVRATRTVTFGALALVLALP